MKIEKRGKYAGVKVHLEPDECVAFIEFTAISLTTLETTVFAPVAAIGLGAKLGKKIKLLLEEEPNLLKDRTPEEIQHELEVEYESAHKKLLALKNGEDWKGVHIT